ncbi:glycosyltransferase [Acidobacteriota bacterium]
MKVDQMIRVLFISPVPELAGGAEHSLVDILTGLSSHGIEPVALCPGEGSLATALRNNSIPVIVRTWPKNLLKMSRKRPVLALGRFVISFGGLFRLVFQMRQVIREGGYSLVSTNGIKAHLISLPATFRLAPVLWHFRDYPPSVLGRLFFSLAGSFIPRRIIAPSYTIGRIFGTGPAKKKQVTVYNGIRAERFQNVPDHLMEKARAELDIAGSRPVIGVIGALVRIKGFHIVMQAMPQVLERFPDSRLLIVGGKLYDTDVSGERQRLEQTARSLGIEKAVRFAGTRDDVPVMLHIMDVFVHSSLIPEPFGRVIVEAMAAGTPVIGSVPGAVDEIIRNRETGTLVPSGDSDALARALIEVLSDRERTEDMTNQARKDVLSRFDLAVTVSRTAEIYRETADLKASEKT